jgi:pimeloyl-ACP methyl ester carboxylesterase
MIAADRHLSVPGARLRYRDEGAGAPVVLVHGWTLDLDIWEPQTPLAAQLRVVRFDRRGCGQSSGNASLPNDVEDLHALITALELVTPMLVGMSQGARVVLDFALRHPSLAGGLLLDGAPPCAQTDLPMALFRETARRGGIDAFRKLWAEHPLTQLVTGDPAIHALRSRVLARYRGMDLLAKAEQTPDSLEVGALGQIHVPVRIVNGEYDMETRRDAGKALCAALPASELTIVANAGHMPNLDAPDDYNRIVSEFAHLHLPVAA